MQLKKDYNPNKYDSFNYVRMPPWRIDLCKDIDDYDAYLYKITIYFPNGNFRVYIGAHLGSIHDGYLCSSKNKELWDDYHNEKNEIKNEIKIEILNKGSVFDMFDSENIMLEEVDARNNPLFYNKTNGGSRFQTLSARIEELMYSLVTDILSGEHEFTTEKFTAEYIKRLIEVKKRHNQVRDELNDDDATAEIANDIDEDGRVDLPPIVLFGDWSDDKEYPYLLIDGHQRIEGILNSHIKDGFKNVKAIIIPKSVWNPLMSGKDVGIFGNTVIKDLGVLLNPRKREQSLTMKPSDIARQVVSRSQRLLTEDDGVTFKSKKERSAAIKRNFNHRFLDFIHCYGSTRNTVYSKAIGFVDDMVQCNDVCGQNYSYLSSTSDTAIERIDHAEAGIRESWNEPVIVIKGPSGQIGTPHVEGQFVLKRSTIETAIETADCKNISDRSKKILESGVVEFYEDDNTIKEYATMGDFCLLDNRGKNRRSRKVFGIFYHSNAKMENEWPAKMIKDTTLIKQFCSFYNYEWMGWTEVQMKAPNDINC
jgi:hypothetical protein